MSEVAIHKGEGVRPEHQHAGAPAQAHGLDSHEHAHGGHHGPAHLHHHFTDTAQQRESNALGMWVFLVTEVMTFGALFFVYTLYRHLFENQAFEAGYASPYAVGSELLDNGLGFINTLVLLASSLTVATAVHAAGMRNRKLLLTMLTVTWILGAVFLGIKAVEWRHDWEEGLVPGLNWNPRTTLTHYGYVLAESTGVNGEAFVPSANLEQTNINAVGPEALEQARAQIAANAPQAHVAAESHGAPSTHSADAAHAGGGHGEEHVAYKGTVNGLHMQMFFVIYFCMTGLHAIHMIIGLGLIAVFMRHAAVGIFTKSANDQPVEIFGLYWHFVDIVWVFLYPLLYLIPVAHIAAAASH